MHMVMMRVRVYAFMYIVMMSVLLYLYMVMMCVSVLLCVLVHGNDVCAYVSGSLEAVSQWDCLYQTIEALNVMHMRLTVNTVCCVVVQFNALRYR